MWEGFLVNAHPGVLMMVTVLIPLVLLKIFPCESVILARVAAALC